VYVRREKGIDTEEKKRIIRTQHEESEESSL